MVAATSDIAMAADTLRDMIAATTGWQNWTNKSETASKLQIDISEIEAADMATMPRCRIGRGEGTSHETQAFATGQGGVASGSLRMTFLTGYSKGNEWGDVEEMTFLNKAGAVITDLLAAGEGLFNLRINQDGAVTRPDEVDTSTRQRVRLTFIVHFGLEGVSV